MTIPQLPIVVNADALLAALRSELIFVRHNEVHYEHCKQATCPGELRYSRGGRVVCIRCGEFFISDDPDNREQGR